ncbi:MAG TPA: hypothetical protein VHZ24_02915 [Pirellulales bacterium]|nr:hypothetical protein [Pirellulales bacterium]
MLAARRSQLPTALVILGTLLAAASGARAQTSSDEALRGWLDYLERTIPRSPEKFTLGHPTDLAKAKQAIDQWSVQMTDFRSIGDLDAALRIARRLLEAKQRVDRQIDALFALRSQFTAAAIDDPRRDQIRSYLRCQSQLIDLSGRLRYLHHDALQAVSRYLCPTTQQRLRLVDMLLAYRSSIGAVVASQYLAGAMPAPAARRRLPAAQPDETMLLCSRVLRLIAASGEASVLPAVVELFNRSDLPAALVLQAGETIRAVGLPQAPRPQPSHDPAAGELPTPAITPRALADRLGVLAKQRLNGDERRRCDTLLAWARDVADRGLDRPSYRLGAYEVQPGDWLLMRNPSPYNLFTDLSPGLFTHVGVVTTERGPDGIERMVVVDLPEAGAKMPATNVEIFLERTLHYVFLRHPDTKVATAMADAAREMIGNETQFDLNFRTDRIAELRGKSLAGKNICTYCAGLLLVCAQQTDEPRREFFPLDEYAAPGRTVENLAKLGMSFGDKFVSPTGALFSQRLALIGRREPMYDPAREIEEAVFDRFAAELMTKELILTPDLYDSLRLKVAEATKHNALLEAAISNAVGVNPETDLVAAARAAAVVETLDEVAFDSSAEFAAAREAIRMGSLDTLARQGYSEADIASIREYRRRHADLFQEFERGQLTPRRLRTSLVDYYKRAGQRTIDERFFAAPTK